jgi:hypothetical protein
VAIGRGSGLCLIDPAESFRNSTLINSSSSVAVALIGPCGQAARVRSPLRITRESERELSQFGATESCQFTHVYGCSKNTRSTATLCHNSRCENGSPTRSARSVSRTAVEGSELICALSGDSKTSWQYSPQNCHSRSPLLFTICGPRRSGHRPHSEACHRGGEGDRRARTRAASGSAGASPARDARETTQTVTAKGEAANNQNELPPEKSSG